MRSSDIAESIYNYRLTGSARPRDTMSVTRANASKDGGGENGKEDKEVHCVKRGRDLAKWEG